MSKKTLFLSLTLLVSSMFCSAEKLGDTPSLLYMQGGIGMQIDVENVEQGVPFNVFVDWIGNISYSTGQNFGGSLALALISQDGEIKELIHEEENVHLSPGSGFGQWQQFCLLIVNTKIASTDIIRFITREDGTDLWLPVTSLECENTYCRAKDNVVNVAEVTVKVLGNNDIQIESYCSGTQYGKAKQDKAVYSSSYYIAIRWPEGKDHHFVKVGPDLDRIQLGTDDILIQIVDKPKYEITLMACSDEDLITDQLQFTVESPGTLGQQLLDNENLLYINNISLSGNLNEDDFQFMRDEMPMLEHIDLSNAQIQGGYLPAGAFESKGIRSLVLPQNLKGLGANSLRGTKLFQLDIPESVTYYGLNALNYSENLTLLVLRNPKVIPVSWCVLEGTNRSKGVLFVPKGTKEAFMADSEWGQFGQIVEGDNTDDWISASDDTYSYSGFYPDVVITGVNHRERIMEIPETVELNGRKLNVIGIGERVFNSGGIQEIHIPKSIIKLGEYAIASGCTSLTDIIVDEDNPVYYSHEGVLYDGIAQTMVSYPRAKREKEYVVPEGVKNIDGWACYCNYIEKITFPSTLETIGACAFYYSALRSRLYPVIVSKAEMPPYIDTSAFAAQTYSRAELYVLAKSLDAYKADNNWGDFYTILPLDDDSGITEIDSDEVLISVCGNILTVKSEYQAEIYGIDGKLLYNSQVDTLVLPAGIYLVRINGKTIKIKI